MRDSEFLLFSSVLFQIISFFTCASIFYGRCVFFLICFILFCNLSLTIFCISLVWERSVLRIFFTGILLMCINSFWNWFRLFSLFWVCLAINLFLYWLAQFHSVYYFVVYLTYLYYTRKKKFYTGVVNVFINFFIRNILP